MKDKLIEHLKKAATAVGIPDDVIKIDYPENLEHGDFSTSVALAGSKKLGKNPRELAEMIVVELAKKMPDFVDSVNIAGAGFINFKIKNKVFAEQMVRIAGGDGKYGRVLPQSKNRSLVEYTDPNIFKTFHIGHLMDNAIGESISRLIEYSGSTVTRICYPSDIGLHIAKSIWAMKKHHKEIPADHEAVRDRTAFLGKMYVEGTNAYDDDAAVKGEINLLNTVLYEKSDKKINELYEKGRKWSLEHFDLLYKKFDTKFDESIFESEMAPVGMKIIRDFLTRGVFAESDGAVVWNPPAGGEDFGLHTRVFINSAGLPTYEAKEIGLNVTKFKKYPDTAESIIFTANEQNDYFKVIMKALSAIDANVSSKTLHIGHGMLRFASGKMSSRTGNVIAAESLIDDLKKLVTEKMVDRNFATQEIDEISDIVAIGAIKYTILRQAIGGDVLFDSTKSISFEGDSGPYLQYSAVRAQAVLDKAKQEGISPAKSNSQLPKEIGLLEKLIARFPDIVERARNEYAPQLVANYLINLAGAFNSFYAEQKIVDASDELSSYRVALTKAFQTTMTNGLWLLGIKVPRKM